MKREIIEFLENNSNEESTYQNLQATTKVMIRRKFIALKYLHP